MQYLTIFDVIFAAICRDLRLFFYGSNRLTVVF